MQHGEKIRTFRIAKSMTQEELAQKVKTNIRTIQRIENGQVKARAYTLKAIAEALEVDADQLILSDTEAGFEKVSRTKLMWLHLSGILLLPTLAIWYFEKDEAPAIGEHGKDVINFQLSMLTILVPCLVFPPLLLLLALFTTVVILVNSFKVGAGRGYYYPLSIGFVRG